MSAHTCITPNTYVILRLPSDQLRVAQIIPNTLISLGKYGTFPANLLLGRPYYLTYAVIERQDEQDQNRQARLRIVPPSELNTEFLLEDISASESRAEPDAQSSELPIEMAPGDGSVSFKNNRLTVDDTSRQTLSTEDIEELKRADTSSGKEVIAQIMKSHANLDEKTVFSLAKYMLRKQKKYMKRFTVLPMDVGMITEWLLTEKEAGRILELREEVLGLITAWSNLHFCEDAPLPKPDTAQGKIGGGRWLVVDETGGLLVAAMAEKMGVLYPQENEQGEEAKEDQQAEMENGEGSVTNEIKTTSHPDSEDTMMANTDHDTQPTTSADPLHPNTHQAAIAKNRQSGALSQTNTIHLLHANAQPNISLLKYFGYDSNNPAPSHPLHTHLKPLSWLQLIDPDSDTTYTEPTPIPASQLQALKSGKRGAYFRKRRRWERCREIVDEARSGGFDGLIVASSMAPQTVLKHLVPLVRGGGHVVVYAATVEPLAELCDFYSRERKAAFIARLEERADNTSTTAKDGDEACFDDDDDDFPVDPRLLLAPSLQTSRVRPWQVLPGRTHPVMSMRGGAEGYVFTARRVVPSTGKVEARGNFNKKRKVG